MTAPPTDLPSDILDQLRVIRDRLGDASAEWDTIAVSLQQIADGAVAQLLIYQCDQCDARLRTAAQRCAHALEFHQECIRNKLAHVQRRLGIIMSYTAHVMRNDTVQVQSFTDAFNLLRSVKNLATATANLTPEWQNEISNVTYRLGLTIGEFVAETASVTPASASAIQVLTDNNMRLDDCVSAPFIDSLDAVAMSISSLFTEMCSVMQFLAMRKTTTDKQAKKAAATQPPAKREKTSIPCRYGDRCNRKMHCPFKHPIPPPPVKEEEKAD